MDNKKTDEYYVKKAIDNIDSIIAYVGKSSFDDFAKNDILIDAVMFRLVQMAENITRISKEYREKYKAIKWGQIIGFRNGIVHDYGKTDYSIVYEIVSRDIYELKMNLECIALETIY